MMVKSILALVKNVPQNIAYEMYLTPLLACPREVLANICNKAIVCI